MPVNNQQKLQVGDNEVTSGAKYAVRNGPAYFPSDEFKDGDFQSPFVQAFMKYRLFDQAFKSENDRMNFWTFNSSRMIRKGREARNQIVQAIKAWHLSKSHADIIVNYHRL